MDFEWDDKKAGHEYRVSQARQLIANVKIIFEDIGETREYVNVIVDFSRKYVHIDQARQQPFLWKQVIDQALKEAESWKERYKKYNQLSLIVNAVEKTINKLRKKSA